MYMYEKKMKEEKKRRKKTSTGNNLKLGKKTNNNYSKVKMHKVETTQEEKNMFIASFVCV